MYLANISKGGKLMKRLAGIIAAVAVLASGAASLGCIWFNFDEPSANGLFRD